MNHTYKTPLGLINPEDLQNSEKILLPLEYEMFPDKRILLIQKDSYLVQWTNYFSKLKNIRRSSQVEFPLESLPWIIDRIENGFWKKPDEGGLSNFERSVSKEFEGETIGINVMMHCCAENMPGFNLWNKSRHDYISKTSLQEWDIPTYMLKDGLLDELKKIATEYC